MFTSLGKSLEKQHVVLLRIFLSYQHWVAITIFFGGLSATNCSRMCQMCVSPAGVKKLQTRSSSHMFDRPCRETPWYSTEENYTPTYWNTSLTDVSDDTDNTCMRSHMQAMNVINELHVHTWFQTLVFPRFLFITADAVHKHSSLWFR